MGRGWRVRIPNSLSCRVCTSFRSCSSSRWFAGISRASEVGGCIVSSQSCSSSLRVRPTQPWPSWLPIPWSFWLSSIFSCSRQRSFRSRAANCSELLSGPGLEEQGNRGWQRPHPPKAASILLQPIIHLPKKHPLCASSVPNLGLYVEKRNKSDQTLHLGGSRLVPWAAAQGSGSSVPQAQVPVPALALTSCVTVNSHLIYLSLGFLTGKW